MLITGISYLVMDYIKMEHFRNGYWTEMIYTDNPPPLDLPEGTMVYVDK